VFCERNIKKVLVFDKYKEAAEKFISEMLPKLQVEMVYTDDTSLLKEANIICTATNSTAPLFKKEDVKKGAHINAIGSF